MKYKDLEKNIQQRLNEYEVPVNTELLIADLFGKESRKYPLLFWLAGSVAVLLATLSMYMWTIKRQIDPEVRPKSELQKGKETSMEIQNNISDRTTKSLISISKSQANEQSLNNEIKSGIISKLNSDKDKFSTNSHNDKANENFNKKSGSSEYKLINSNVNSSGTPIGKNRGSIIGNYEENILNYTTTSKSNSSDLSINSDLPQLEPANVKSVISNNYSEDNSLTLPGVKCPTFKRKKQWMFSVIPEVGYFYPLTSFQYNNNAAVLDLRKNNESTLEGLQAALYGKISNRRTPWYIKSGINYDRITRKMSLNQNFTRSDTTIGIISITESQNGDTITVIRGPIITESRITRREVRHYYHHLWSIPLTIGFQKHNDYFEWGLEAGVNFNLSSKQTGFVMTTADDFGLISNTGLYKRQIGLSYLAQAHIGLPFNERNVLALAIRANINPNNFATNASSIDEKYQMLGAHLMYEFRF